MTIYERLWKAMSAHPRGSTEARRYSKMIALHLTPWGERAELIEHWNTWPGRKNRRREAFL